MWSFKCESCGSVAYTEKDKNLVCDFCGRTYLLDKNDSVVLTNKKASEMYRDVDISLQNDLTDLLRKCKLFPEKASKFARLALEIDPYNEEAKKYI